MISNESKLDAQNKERQMGEMGQRLVRSLDRQVAEAVPMPVVAGPVVSRNGVAPSIAPQDPIFLSKTAGSLISPALRLKNESLIAFCARTELSLHEIRTLPRKELERLIKIRAANRTAEGVVAPVNTVRLPPAPEPKYVAFVDTDL